jgi:hypothetical protein
LERELALRKELACMHETSAKNQQIKEIARTRQILIDVLKE